MAALGATPSGQVDNRIFIYGGIPRSLEAAGGAIRLLGATVEGLSVNVARMGQLAAEGHGYATDLSDILMKDADISADQAHRVVGRVVRSATETGSPLTRELLAQAAREIVGREIEIPDVRLDEVMDPGRIVRTRTGRGGAAPEAVTRQLAEIDAGLVETRTWCQAARDRLRASEHELLDAARELAG